MRNIIVVILICCSCAIVHAQQLPNGDFESFGDRSIDILEYDFGTNSFNGTTCTIDGDGAGTTSTLNATDRPENWSTSAEIFQLPSATYATSTTDANTGSTAIRLDNGSGAFSNSFIGVVGIFQAETGFFDTLPVSFTFTNIPTAVEGFYKHTAGQATTINAGSCTRDGVLTQNTTFDSAFSVYAEFLKLNSATGENELVASAYQTYPAVSSYTAFSAPVTIETGKEGEIPDRLLLLIANSSWAKAPNAIQNRDAVSFVDDITFNYQALSNNDFAMDNNNFMIYPNPVDTQLNLRNAIINEDVFVYDLTGKLILKTTIVSVDDVIDFEFVNDGIYLLKYKESLKKIVVSK